MNFLHNILLAVKISGIIIVGLVVMAVIMATVRALKGKISLAWTKSDVPVAEANTAREGWIHRSLVAFDIFMNVWVLRGQQGVTISAHSWRASQEGKVWGKVMNWWLGCIQSNHGYLAACGDLERAKAVVDVLSRDLGV